MPVVRSLDRLGRAMLLASRRRYLTQKDLASRMITRVNTLWRMEAGHSWTARVHFASALQLFGEIDKFDLLLDASARHRRFLADG